MKNELETGIKAFIEAAERESDSIDPGDPVTVPVHAASSDETIDETAPYFAILCEDISTSAGLLSTARVMIVLSSPHERGYESDHRDWMRFLRQVFAPAVPPNLSANAAHLSEYIETATVDTASRGFHVVGNESSTGDGIRQDGIRLSIGLHRDDPDPFVSSGPITV